MARHRTPSLIRTRGLLSVLVGTVVLPAFLSISVGIVALALWREDFDIVFGVLVLVFAVLSVIGAFVTLALLRRSERLVEMQSDFVANVSHELRTPLAGVRLMVETLERNRAEDPVQRAEVLALLAGGVSRLEAIVERILRWRRLEAGAMAYDWEDVDAEAVVREAVAPFVEVPGGSAAEIELLVRGPLPRIRGDRAALLDAVHNLVENAVKFGGERGPVEVLVASIGREIVIEVRDQGPGIPRRERRRIFERFYRAAVHLRSKQGSGLGLAIVRQVIADHGGRITVESEPGVGSAFIVRLPARERRVVPRKDAAQEATDGE